MRGLIISVLLLFLTLCGKSTLSERVSLHGHFTSVGNAPFIKLVFRADDGTSYETAPGEAGKFRELQGRPLAITGSLKILSMKTADGRYTRQIRIIRDISIADEGPAR